MSKAELNAIVIQRIDLSSELFILRVAPDGWAIPSFKPGQFAVLGLPASAPRCSSALPEAKPSLPEKIIQRAYSIASSPLIPDYLEFYITLVREGVLTPRLYELKAGDKVVLGQKISGNFILEAPETAHILFIATGTGIAPFMSMLQTYLRPGGRRFALFHGVRESIDLGYRSEMMTLQNVCNEFSYHPVLSRPQGEKISWKGPTGHVQELWNSGILEKKWGVKPAPVNTHIFLCGSPAMIESMIALLGKEGFREHKKTDPGQIHVERYW